MSETDIPAVDPVERTSDIISAYVAHNVVQPSALPELIASVHAALQSLNNPTPAEPEKPTPPIPIRRTVTPDHIISLEDGKPYKTLKRHLSGRGLTPEQYREKWGLPRDYPMVAANYASQRSVLAKNSGLGQHRAGRSALSKAAAPDAKVTDKAASRGRSRRTKAPVEA
ncbi:MucR family transcriptional regulator [Methylobacterium variabile]|jgi:predicted transcriptional regulator|uniref:MucR family transcriptional regulator n=1 Tax=Methylobacterium variabile TaxID=298794 RepID=A0A0J6T974_9HYPH|nr:MULTISPECIES: MucR family transcriptional regulator [Methylobacterium]KMO42083.1 MucR family transcriptional regulator [Methylobacterium variabile]NGM37258.1 MucR family transcriptional regulator [Methylobacterium sp. DB0501]UHC20385.1 MucR family transcriptional regulator [Methylobacterium currus]